MADKGEQFTGLSKYFNNTTLYGRANVAKVTYGVVAILGLYLYLKPKKEKEVK